MDPAPGPDWQPDWQLVLVLWGTKYPVAEVNHLIAGVRAHAAPAPARIVLLGDRLREGLAPGVRQIPLPQAYRTPRYLARGCQAKLAMFADGLVPPDMPAVYVDIDTVVLGNLARLVGLVRGRGVAMLPASAVPFGRVGRWAHRVTGGRRHVRGNSSLVVYHPAHCGPIAARFLAMAADPETAGLRVMQADDRFLSWVHQDHLRTIPNDLAVKFTTEFMVRWRWWGRLRARLPWVRRRWAGLVAVTLPGLDAKGATLLDLPDGAELTEARGRRVVWSDRALGSVRAGLRDHYAALREGADSGPGGQGR